jgi:hypothetical protein
MTTTIAKSRPKPRWRRMAGVAAVLLVLALAATLFIVYRASRHVPQFYQQALAADPVVQRSAGDELERRALELTNEVQHSGDWEAVFTDEQINGWLAVDLIEKFPDLLPSEVHEPRVVITPDEVRVACRYTDENITAVISLALTVGLTDEPNVVAVRVKRVRAGALPIPLNQFLDDITQAARESGLDLRWTQAEGDPVALIRLPTENTELPDRTLHLKKFELRAGEAYLAGETQWKSRTPPAAE